MPSQDDMGLGSDLFSDPSPDSDSSDNHSHIIAWVLIPLCILIICTVGLAVLRWRRRKAQQQLHGISLLQRDVEAMGPNRIRRAPTSRWQWVVGDPRYRSQRMDLFGSRTEGLNEFGEAPPAYTPPQKRPDDVELHAVVTSALSPQMQIQNQGQNTLLPPSQAGAPATTRIPEPPAYGTLADGPRSASRTEPTGSQESTSQGTSHGLSAPTLPAPAHVPSS